MSPVFATEDNHAVQLRSSLQSTNLEDTTELTQFEYEECLVSIGNSNLGIQSICEMFISSIYACRRDDSYDCTIFAFDQSNLDDTLAYFQCRSQYQREVSELYGYRVVSDHIEFGDFSATVTGENCTAEISVHYSYQLAGSFDEMCYQNCVYYLTLRKDGNSWRIVTTTSNMPCENSDGFTYGYFDAHAAALASVGDIGFTELEIEQIQISDNSEYSINGEVLPSLFTKTTYNRTAAVNYAAQYFNQTNSVFGFISGENCQNFASQCVWAGLLGGCNASGNSSTAIPAVSTSFVGSNAPNVWCHNQCTTYYSHYTNNWAWDNVNGFLRLIWESNYSQCGPQGNYLLGLSKVSAGDVIIWDTSGTRDFTSGSYDHAMFVTKVTGTSGSRGVGNVFIAANTSQTSSAYQPLTDYCSYPASYFGTAQIICGYY